MKSKIQSIYSNQVWDLMEPPEGIKSIGCKWIYKKKRGAYGKVETFKDRLVETGFTQKEGIDYEETFSLISMLKSIQILLSIAAHFNYEIWQMDVKTSFLNGHLEEFIYMMQLDGFLEKAKNTCCASLRDPFMDLSKHLDLGILAFIKPLNLMVLINVLMSPVCTKSLMEAWWCS